MAWPGDLQAIHNPATNTSPPAAWGDAVRDALQFLAGTAGAEVLTSQTTASTSYTALATAGPSVTVATGTRALVVVSFWGSVGTVGSAVMSHAVSGATTIASSDSWSAVATSASAGQTVSPIGVAYHAGLTAGSNTFTAQYKVNTGTGTFLYRKLFVIPLT